MKGKEVSPDLQLLEPFSPSDLKDEQSKEAVWHLATLPQREEQDDEVPKNAFLSKRTEAVMMTALCVALFVAGWNDASVGPLIPSLQDHYNVNYTVVSLVFILSFCGFASAAVINVWLTDRFGFGAVIATGAAVQLVSFSLICWAPPFGVFVFAMYLNGLGTGLQARRSGERHFYFHFLVSVGICAVNTCNLAAVFRFKSHEGIFGRDVTDTEERTSTQKFKKLLSLSRTYLMALELLFYVGLEVTIGGWIVRMLSRCGRKIELTNGVASVISGDLYFGIPRRRNVVGICRHRLLGRYAASIQTYKTLVRSSPTISAGLAVGRIVLIPVNRKVKFGTSDSGCSALIPEPKLGDALAIYVYLAVVFALEFVVWFAPNVIANAVAVSFMGMFLGPIFPLVMNVAAKVFPLSMLTGACGLIASTGAAGAALFPFITGALSERFGVKTMQPVIVAMLAVCFLLWIPVPKRAKDLKKKAKLDMALERVGGDEDTPMSVSA
ncbi:hypothetical protein NliqN6_2506 [Naganishia liquefaciens]|uniref:MFS transporter n=1 Tax=Naganishia liquefaciens TaxID=104408 RepID=A0A8H3TTV2_9TREE|nr:hypothetical protein NliqN6_2506 [Naganishia liquefaciens]